MRNYTQTVVICNQDTNEHFFSTDHCQGDLPDDWIPITHYRDKEYVRAIFFQDSKEIPNPNPDFQA